MKALILASGEGTRLRPLTIDRNKGMLPVDGRPVLEHIVGHLREHDIRDIVMAVGVKKEQVMEHFKDGFGLGVKIKYSVSECVQETAGEIARARELLNGCGDFILHYGDALTNLNLTDFCNFHKEHNGAITGPGMREVYTESGIYVCGGRGFVIGFYEKPFINDLIPLPGLFSNVPIYCVSEDVLGSENVAYGKDFNNDVLPEFVKKRGVRMFFQEDLWHLDVGSVKKYNEICKAYERGEQAKLRKLA